MTHPVVLCMGTRPEIIKMAPVYHGMVRRGTPVAVMHTGQHQDMAWPLYDFFDIRPQCSIALERKSDRLADLSATLLSRLGAALAEMQPPLVVVHGDTSSALMGSLAAFYQQVPIAHVEAGLRTHMQYSPFPEEKNRELIARLAQWHFAPTPQARSNLLQEGVPEERIHMVGNTVIDATLWGVRQLESLADKTADVLPPALGDLTHLADDARLLLVTAHRRENWSDGIAAIAEAVKDLLIREPSLVAAWPVHANAKVRTTVHQVFSGAPAALRRRAFLCEPLNYPALLWLLKKSWLVLTDSGGIQEEAAALHKPVLVLRDSTERPELIESGMGLLVGCKRSDIVATTLRLHCDAQAYARMQRGTNPFGDGHAGDYIATILSKHLDQPGQTLDAKRVGPPLLMGETSC